ncbi:MAG: hypothetical protein OHK0036_17810 [Bacteroidia bacterium]
MKGGYYVYVLFSQKDGKRYTGMCKDIVERIQEHNKGNVPSTKSRRPLVLLYYEWCQYYKDAVKREKYLKSYYGKKYIKNRVKNFYQRISLKYKLKTINK